MQVQAENPWKHKAKLSADCFWAFPSWWSVTLFSAARFPWRKGTSVQCVLNSGDTARLQPSEGSSWLLGQLWSFLLTACEQPGWADVQLQPWGERLKGRSLPYASSSFPSYQKLPKTGGKTDLKGVSYGCYSNLKKNKDCRERGFML